RRNRGGFVMRSSPSGSQIRGRQASAAPHTPAGTILCMSSNTSVSIRPTSQKPAPDRDAIQAAIDYLRPALQYDGGDLSLVDVSDDGVVTVRFAGACVGCPISMMTLQAGVERILKDRVPGVTEVVAVED